MLGANTLYGTTQYGGVGYNGNPISGYGTVFALNVTSATVALSNIANAVIITGGTATLGAVSNSSTAGLNLNYTLTAAVVSGSTSLGAVTPASGSLAPSASQSFSVSATSGFGVNALSFTASDPNSATSARSRPQP